MVYKIYGNMWSLMKYCMMFQSNGDITTLPGEYLGSTIDTQTCGVITNYPYL